MKVPPYEGSRHSSTGHSLHTQPNSKVCKELIQSSGAKQPWRLVCGARQRLITNQTDKPPTDTRRLRSDKGYVKMQACPQHPCRNTSQSLESPICRIMQLLKRVGQLTVLSALLSWLGNPTGFAANAAEALHRREYFYIGGDYIENGGQHLFENQMYVEKLTPQRVRQPYPIVFAHGGAQSGTVSALSYRWRSCSSGC